MNEYKTKIAFNKISNKVDTREKVSITREERKAMTVRQGIRFLFNGNKIKLK